MLSTLDVYVILFGETGYGSSALVLQNYLTEKEDVETKGLRKAENSVFVVS